VHQSARINLRNEQENKLRQLFRDLRFTFAELILILLCGIIWLASPQWVGWFVAIALLAFILKFLSGEVRFISLDWLILVFFITTWVGYWAAYDQATAWNKAWLVVTGVLLYFSLRAQPNENLIKVSVLLFSVGVGVSLYYFLTYNFIAAPRRLEFVNNIGRWFMSIRPQTNWTPIHPNYVAGITAITVPFIFYPIWKIRNDNRNIPVWFSIYAITGLGIACLAIVMATSRGVILAICSGLGVWFLWRLTHLSGIKSQIKSDALFPLVLSTFLCAVIIFLYAGPAQSGNIFSGPYFYGTGSRAELFSRSLYLVFDYPITGGGLGAFPGLYSQYLLNIPFFNVPNSHNLFLDVAIEQGLFGGLSFLILYVMSLWTVSSSIVNGNSNQVFMWVVLFSMTVAIVHGMVDDYLYNGVGSILALFLVGLSLREKLGDPSNTQRLEPRTIGAILMIWVVVALVNLNVIRSVWYANLGAVQLAKVELDGFPNNGWAGSDIIPKLDMAASTLLSSLQLDPVNWTANQRLGMISMLRRDFESAVGYLETAHRQAPRHRGIIKSLGYSYAWLGEMDRAELFLSQIPEAKDELDVYTWWWKLQGRSDLSEDARLALATLINAPSQP